MRQSYYNKIITSFCLLYLIIGVFIPCSAQQPDDVNTTYFRRITNKNDLVSDGLYLIITEDELCSINATTSGYKGLPIECSPKGIYQGPVRTGDNSAPYEFTICSQSAKYNLNFYGKDGKTKYYVAGGGSSNTSLTYVKLLSEATTSWNITFDKDGYVQMYTTNQNYNLCYDKGEGIFRLSDKANITALGYQRISIYRKEHLIPISEATGGYTTFYNNGFAYFMPSGLTSYAIDGVNPDNSLHLNSYYREYNAVPESTALLLYGSSGTYIAPLCDSNAEITAVTNYMEGTRDDNNFTMSKRTEDVEYFKLGLGPNRNKLGFYWGAENGEAFKMTKATTAYLALPKSMIIDKKVLSLPLNPTITKITHIEADAPAITYDLSGRKMTQPRHGIYIKHGRKYIAK